MFARLTQRAQHTACNLKKKPDFSVELGTFWCLIAQWPVDMLRHDKSTTRSKTVHTQNATSNFYYITLMARDSGEARSDQWRERLV